MRQIKHQFSLYFMLLIVTAVVLFESLIIGYSAHFYRAELYSQLESQATSLIQTLQRGLSEASLEQQLARDTSLLTRFGGFRVQLYNAQGELLMDSSGNWSENPPVSGEIATALSGKPEKTGTEDQGGYISLTLPIHGSEQIEGVVRLSASTLPIQQQVKKMATYFLGIGAAVVVVTGVGAYILATTVTSPIQSLIRATRQMASGDFSNPPEAIYDDEIGELAESIAFFGSEIERREAEKNAMFSSVSHELRTPLTAIRGWAETLSDSSYKTDQEVMQEGLETISKEALRLTGLVEELLDYTRLSQVKMAFDFEETDLVDIVLTTVSTLKPKAAARGVCLDAAISEKAYDDLKLASAMVDGARLKQMCLNLLDNSIKFTPSGGRVQISLEAQEDFAVFCISDTGAGIEPEILPKVKERFVKGAHPESHLGLGLAICERIIQEHQGSWHIASELQKGTHITVHLPLIRNKESGV